MFYFDYDNHFNIHHNKMALVILILFVKFHRNKWYNSEILIINTKEITQIKKKILPDFKLRSKGFMIFLFDRNEPGIYLTKTESF